MAREKGKGVERGRVFKESQRDFETLKMTVMMAISEATIRFNNVRSKIRLLDEDEGTKINNLYDELTRESRALEEGRIREQYQLEMIKESVQSMEELLGMLEETSEEYDTSTQLISMATRLDTVEKQFDVKFARIDSSIADLKELIEKAVGTQMNRSPMPRAPLSPPSLDQPQASSTRPAIDRPVETSGQSERPNHPTLDITAQIAQGLRNFFQQEPRGRLPPRPEYFDLTGSRVVKIKEPPPYKEDGKQNFRTWWKQVENYFEQTQKGWMADDGYDRILFVGSLLRDSAQEWFQEYQEEVEEDPTKRSWEYFKQASFGRFVSKFEKTEANKKMRALEYTGNIEEYITKIKLLNARVKCSGTILKDMVIDALPYKISERLSYIDEDIDDKEFLALVVKAGKERELFEQRQEAKKKFASKLSAVPKTDKTMARKSPEPPRDRKRSRRNSTPPPAAKKSKFDKRFNTLKEALEGTNISEKLAERRIKDKLCARCGAKSHLAYYCHTQAKVAEIEVGEPEEENGSRSPTPEDCRNEFFIEEDFLEA